MERLLAIAKELYSTKQWFRICFVCLIVFSVSHGVFWAIEKAPKIAKEGSFIVAMAGGKILKQIIKKPQYYFFPTYSFILA